MSYYVVFFTYLFFFFNDTPTTKFYTLFPTRRSSDLIVCGNDLYGGVPRLFNQVLSNFGMEFTYVDTSDADRKSTRLNSSHVSISYAVFCLKKKNEIVSN